MTTTEPRALCARAKFRLGNRVCLSSEGQRAKVSRGATGRVVGFARQAASMSVWILRDGYKTPTSFHCKFWEIAPLCWARERKERPA